MGESFVTGTTGDVSGLMTTGRLMKIIDDIKGQSLLMIALFQNY